MKYLSIPERFEVESNFTSSGNLVHTSKRRVSAYGKAIRKAITAGYSTLSVTTVYSDGTSETLSLTPLLLKKKAFT